MGSEVIQELEEDKKKLHIECLFLSESLDMKIRELSKTQTDLLLLKDNYSDLLEDVKNLRVRVVLVDEQLKFTRELLTEERTERKELTDRIQVFAGLKEREVASVSVNPETETKAWESLHKTGGRTRSAIKNQLEERARELLEQQRRKEDKEITKGELAPGDVLLEAKEH